MNHGQSRNFIIAVLSVAFLAISAAVIVPRVFAVKNQLTDEQRADMDATGALLRKMSKMCDDAGVEKLQDSFLGPNDAVTCVSYGGEERTVGSLPAEKKALDELRKNALTPITK